MLTRSSMTQEKSVRARLSMIAALALACSVPAAANSSDDLFDALSSKEWAFRQQTFQSAESSKGGIPPHLPDESAEAQRTRLAVWTDTLARLDAIDVRTLSPDKHEDYGVYRAQIATLLDAQRFHDFEKPLNSDSSFWADLGYYARQPMRNERDARNMLSLMRDIPRFFAQNIANMRAGSKRGFTPPKVIMAGRDQSIAPVATTCSCCR